MNQRGNMQRKKKKSKPISYKTIIKNKKLDEFEKSSKEHFQDEGK